MYNSYDKRFSVSILLWMRTDNLRQQFMDYWKGPHSKIIAASPGLLEYRQQHLSDSECGFWPEHEGIETAIPEDRRVDGIAEVTFQSLMAPVAGLHQTSLAFKDEVNVFRRTLMHMGVPGSSRWYRLSGTEKTQLRDVLYFRRRPDVGSGTFKSFVHRFADHISESGKVTELRTQVYLPWNKLTWNTPDVAHDNPKEHQLHASLIMGFPDEDTRRHFYDVTAQKWNTEIEKYASAVHSYRITETIPYVENGKRL